MLQTHRVLAAAAPASAPAPGEMLMGFCRLCSSLPLPSLSPRLLFHRPLGLYRASCRLGGAREQGEDPVGERCGDACQPWTGPGQFANGWALGKFPGKEWGNHAGDHSTQLHPGLPARLDAWEGRRALKPRVPGRAPGEAPPPSVASAQGMRGRGLGAVRLATEQWPGPAHQRRSANPGLLNRHAGLPAGRPAGGGAHTSRCTDVYICTRARGSTTGHVERECSLPGTSELCYPCAHANRTSEGCSGDSLDCRVVVLELPSLGKAISWGKYRRAFTQKQEKVLISAARIAKRYV
ncbi:uncharacterized protein LOC122446773 [Cervus canadensis]|uniref:uncharacterized protein LOC122446773 n=1 Tax=Cervus canadensis TaxID=1574408 RepID=UPI001C9E517E|nr:uncharacterized protein LOC122446773 [Cervus canadensis]